jgi:hypothetical protein
MKINLAYILADKTLQQHCGQNCVDWAITMLEEGRDGDFLARLAGMQPPYNHFELADFRDRALLELGVAPLDGPAAIKAFAAERLRLALSGQMELIVAVSAIKELCLEHGHLPELNDFQLLYWAWSDLRDFNEQWYWSDATRENINEIIRQRAIAFLDESTHGE